MLRCQCRTSWMRAPVSSRLRQVELPGAGRPRRRRRPAIGGSKVGANMPRKPAHDVPLSNKKPRPVEKTSQSSGKKFRCRCRWWLGFAGLLAYLPPRPTQLLAMAVCLLDWRPTLQLEDEGPDWTSVVSADSKCLHTGRSRYLFFCPGSNQHWFNKSPDAFTQAGYL